MTKTFHQQQVEHVLRLLDEGHIDTDIAIQTLELVQSYEDAGLYEAISK